ncbi:MAG: hypothetical protein AB7N76_21985 [Planctomycetota bacterium]
MKITVKKTQIFAALLAAAVSVGCSGGGGGGGGFASTTTAGSTGQVTSALPTVSRDASGYSFGDFYNNGVKNSSIKAMETAPVGTQTGVLVGDAPFSNITAVASGTAPMFEVKTSYDVSSFATVGTQTYAATANRDAPGAGDLYVRDAGTGSWSRVRDGGSNEMVVAVVGSNTMFTAEGSINGSMKVRENNIEVAAVNSARPTAAIDFGGALWVGATESKATGGAASLYNFAKATPEKITLPVASIGQGVFQRVTGLAVAELQSSTKVMFVAVGEFDDQGAALSGSVLVTVDGKTYEPVASFSKDAPTAVAWIDSTVYVGTASGALRYRDDKGDMQDEPSLPANNGVTSLLVFGTDLYIGCKVSKGAQIFRRVPNSGSIVPGPNPNPTPTPTKKYYDTDIAPIFAAKCASCHNGGVPAAEAAWPLTSPVSMQADHTEVQSRLDLANPAMSELLTKATNDVNHVGGEVIKKTDAEYTTILAWITDGAPFDSNSGNLPPAPKKTFNGDVFPLLQADCMGCHNNGQNSFNAGPNQTNSFTSSVSKTNQTPGQEAMSALLRKPSRDGVTHGGGTIWAKGSAKYNAVLAWIQDGVLRQ